jgi:glutathione S-transferase
MAAKQPKFSLAYFAVRAKGEHLRYLLAQGGADYEDIELTDEQWAKIKNEQPFGQVPVLTVNARIRSDRRLSLAHISLRN